MTDDYQSIDELLEQGIRAAKNHDQVTARVLLERVVETDQHNEKAWFWLAAVIDDIEEKHICLENVLHINPNNERAAALLKQLPKISGNVPAFSNEADSARALPAATGDLEAESTEEQRFTPGSTGTSDTFLRRVAGTDMWQRSANSRAVQYAKEHPVTVASGAAALAVFAVILLIILTSGGGGDSDQSTSGAMLPTPQNSVGGAVSALPTPTLISMATSSPPPPTWTPVPSPTPIPAVVPTLYPLPPDTLPGTIILESGDVPGDQENHPIVLMKADGSSKRTLTGQSRGHAAALSPDGSEYAYIEFLSGTREEIMKLDNIQGTAPRNASNYWRGSVRLFEQDNPEWSPDGSWIAFTAIGMGATLPDLYRVLLVEGEGRTPLERLTDDDVVEGWPAFSPDSARIVYVADKSKLEFDNPVDLRIYDLSSGEIIDITTNGSDIIESAPDWSPDGQYIIFQGKSADSPDFDIYRIPAFGLGVPEKIIDSEADDIRPHYSPNGRYVAFSSNRTGNWDVFVYDTNSDEMYQLTSESETEIASDWGR